jgi:hypothetical protein
MPLHDWTDDRGWDSIHQLWINALLGWLQGRLPGGYRAYLGSVPGLRIWSDKGGAFDRSENQTEIAARRVVRCGW